MVTKKSIDFQKRIPEIFQEAQKTASNHRKNLVVLRKLYESSSEAGKEAEFIDHYINTLNRILPLKKKEITADRIIRLLNSFLAYSKDKDNKEQNDDHDITTGSTSAITLTMKFADKLVSYYIDGVDSKEKMVRYRSCQILASCLGFIGPIEEDFFVKLRETLLKRSQDKDSAVRVQVVFALASLQGEDEQDQNDEVITKMIEMLHSDSSPDVRKTALGTITQNLRTLPHILERCRDFDVSVRRLLYKKTLVEIGDFRQLSIEQRENLLKWGFSDRDEQVKSYCDMLLSNTWMPLIENNLVEFLEKLDVMNSEVAQVTLLSFFEAHPDTCKDFEFPEGFWENLTIESAFLAKAFISYFHSKEDDVKLDQIMPSASQMAALLKDYCNRAISLDESELRGDFDFILVQLLEITSLLDFADELGRRKVFAILRQLFTLVEANDDQIKVMVSVVRKLSKDEIDFVRTIVEILTDIQQELTEEQQTLSLKQIEEELEAGAEEASDDYNDFLNTMNKCLIVLKAMLQLCDISFEKNPLLSGLLSDTIHPASKCQIEVLHDVGTECLGLCCMLDKELAEKNIQLFIRICKDDSEEIRYASLKMVLDLCALYGISPSPFQISTTTLVDFLKTCLKDEDPEFLAIAAQGISKLFLAGLIYEAEILERMILLYFIPTTQDNIKLRQCLHYFLEVYSHFNPKNQAIMSKAFTTSLFKLISMYKKYGSKFSMASPFQMGQQLCDWTDPRKIFDDKIDTSDIHLVIAIDLLKAAFENDEGSRKIIFQILTKLITETMVSPIKLICVNMLVKGFHEKCQFPDLVSKNSLTKFEASITLQIESTSSKDQVLETDPELIETKEWLDAFEKEATPILTRTNSGKGSASKRRKVKKEIYSDGTEEETEYEP